MGGFLDDEAREKSEGPGEGAMLRRRSRERSNNEYASFSSKRGLVTWVDEFGYSSFLGLVADLALPDADVALAPWSLPLPLNDRGVPDRDI